MRSLTNLILGVVVFSGCGPSVKSVSDDRPSFTLDSSKPFRIEFGRGNGWHGLDTITVDEMGNVSLQRRTSIGWENASFGLNSPELKTILESLNENRIMDLMRVYHLDGVASAFEMDDLCSSLVIVTLL